MSGITEDMGRENVERLRIGRLGLGALNRRSMGWYGVMMLIITEAFLFVYLLFSYFYIASQNGEGWLPAEKPGFHLSGPNTLILILSSVAVWIAERGAKSGGRRQQVLGLGAAFLLGCIFVYIQFREWMEKPFELASHSYGSLFFTITGFHMAHVLAGLLMLAVLALWASLGFFDEERHAPLSIGAIYWHFVDAVWLAVFFSLYVTPYMG